MAAVSSQTFSQEMRQQANAALMKLDKGAREKISDTYFDSPNRGRTPFEGSRRTKRIHNSLWKAIRSISICNCNQRGFSEAIRRLSRRVRIEKKNCKSKSNFWFRRNNFLRLCVLRVVQDSQAHLEKILNVDEFMKRIFSVIHSNDPIARSLTLRYKFKFAAKVARENNNFYIRMFGSLAPIVAERKNVHHR